MCGRLVCALSAGGIKLKGLSLQPSVGVPGVVTASLGGATFASAEQEALTLRQVIAERFKRLPAGRGIVFTIDETQAASMEDMVALATTLQHVIRDEDLRSVPDSEKHGVAFAFAALPSLMDELLHEKVLTFLRRSMQRDLGPVPLPDVRLAYVETVREAGKSIDDEVAPAAATAADGYPYMIQLVGYYMWRSAEARGSRRIEAADVAAAVSDALLAFDDAVCAPLLDGLTTAQRLFVECVAADDPQPTRVSGIAACARRSASWVSKYRASLLKERVIEEAGRGFVRLSTPHLAEFIRKVR